MGVGSKGYDHFLSLQRDRELLTRSQVARLQKRYRAGDKRALEKLVLHNTFLVVKIAGQFYFSKKVESLAFEDLIQIGFEGLMTAIDRYEPKRGNAFSTYATWWIRQRIQRGFDDTDRLIRQPVHMRETMRRAFRIRSELYALKGRDPEWTEVWEALLGKYPKTLASAKDLIAKGIQYDPVSLDDAHALGGNNSNQTDDRRNIGHILPDRSPDADVQGEHLEQGEEDIDAVLSHLPERTELIVRQYFGLLNEEDESRTLQVVGEIHGLSRERIRQVVSDGLDEARRLYRKRGYVVPPAPPPTKRVAKVLEGETAS